MSADKTEWPHVFATCVISKLHGSDASMCQGGC